MKSVLAILCLVALASAADLTRDVAAIQPADCPRPRCPYSKTGKTLPNGCPEYTCAMPSVDDVQGATEAKTNIFTAEHDGQRVTVDGTEFTIKLSANPSVGTVWKTPKATGCVTPAGAGRSNNFAPPGAVGGPIENVWMFKLESAGCAGGVTVQRAMRGANDKVYALKINGKKAAKESVITEADNGKVVKVPGTAFTLQLKGNPSAGSSWQNVKTTGCVKQSGTSRSNNFGPSGVVGGSIQNVWAFTLDSAGCTGSLSVEQHFRGKVKGKFTVFVNDQNTVVTIADRGKVVKVPSTKFTVKLAGNPSVGTVWKNAKATGCVKQAGASRSNNFGPPGAVGGSIENVWAFALASAGCSGSVTIEEHFRGTLKSVFSVFINARTR